MNVEQKWNLRLFILVIFLYGINRFSSVFSSIPNIGIIFRNHFNDYLGAIAFISITNFLRIKNDFRPCETVPALFFWGTICSISWEGITPLFFSKSTADWLDCLAYYLGMLTYWCLLHDPIRKNRSN